MLIRTTGRLKAAPTVVLLALAAAGCGGNSSANPAPADAPTPLAIQTASAVEQPITRFIRASGTLTAQDDAEVAAEIAGGVVSTPVERGMPVRMGAELIRIAAAEVEAQAQEADANVAQIQARLGLEGAPPADLKVRPCERVARSMSSAFPRWPPPGRPTTWRRPTSTAPRCSRKRS